MKIRSIVVLAATLATSVGASTFQPRRQLKNRSCSTLLDISKHAKANSCGVESRTVAASSISGKNNILTNSRGGGDAVANVDVPKPKELMGASFFILLQLLLKELFDAQKIAFPAMMAGTILVFTSLVLIEAISPGAGDNIFELLQPGANFLTKWLPVMFVPGLAMLPLAPSIGSASDILKVLSMITLGFVFTLATTSYLVLAMRTAQGLVEKKVEDPTKKNVGAPVAATSTPWPQNKPFSEQTLLFLLQGTMVTGAISVAATRKKYEHALPIRTIAMFFGTFFTYVFGARLPASFTKVVHPLVTSTIGVLLLAQFDSFATESSFSNVLKTYRSGSLSPSKTGAGDLLLFLLGPTVGSLSIAMYSRKKIMAENLAVVVAAMLCSSLGGLYGTAWFVRLMNIGSNVTVRLSLITRNITTALAIVITQILKGDMAIAASVVVLTGIFGATVGRGLLDLFKIDDPVSRGLGMGAAGQGLGVAAMAPEKEAFPFAAINMVLTAVCSTLVVSVPTLRENLVNIVSAGVGESA